MSGQYKYRRNPSACKIAEESACTTACKSMASGPLKIEKWDLSCIYTGHSPSHYWECRQNAVKGQLKVVTFFINHVEWTLLVLFWPLIDQACLYLRSISCFFMVRLHNFAGEIWAQAASGSLSFIKNSSFTTTWILLEFEWTWFFPVSLNIYITKSKIIQKILS